MALNRCPPRDHIVVTEENSPEKRIIYLSLKRLTWWCNVMCRVLLKHSFSVVSSTYIFMLFLKVVSPYKAEKEKLRFECRLVKKSKVKFISRLFLLRHHHSMMIMMMPFSRCQFRTKFYLSLTCCNWDLLSFFFFGFVSTREKREKLSLRTFLSFKIRKVARSKSAFQG